VRGAFAASWLARNGVSAPRTPERAEFLRLFEGGVRFGPLLRPGTAVGWAFGGTRGSGIWLRRPRSGRVGGHESRKLAGSGR
jgi:hypothetical protein